jgi:hypothetical protein
VSDERSEHLEQELKALYSEVPAPPAGLAKGRERMLAEAAQLKSRSAYVPILAAGAHGGAKSTRRRKMNLMLAYKVLAAVMAVALAVTGVGGGAVLAQDTVPGDLLYPAKLLSEDARLAFTQDPADRAALVMAYVAERVEEMERLAQRGEEIPADTVALMTRQMEQVMVEIARSRPDEAPALMERLMENMRLHQQALEQAGAGTGDQTQTRLREACEEMERIRQNAENDPAYLEYQNQHRYEGTPGPHDEMSPQPAGEGEQTREQSQYSYEGTPGPHGMASPEPSEDPDRNQNQERYEGTSGPHGQGTPTPTATVSPDAEDTTEATCEPECVQDRDQDKDQDRDQDRDGGDQDSENEGEGSPTDMPKATDVPKGSGTPKSGH